MNALDQYTASQFESELSKLCNAISFEFAPVEHPKAFLLGGQSGAGKSTLHKIYREQFHYNVVVINGDEYRKLHPHFHQLDAVYGKDAVEHTARWAGAMTEGLIDALSKEGYNLIIEGTLRTSTVPLKTARLLRSRGYGVSLALMAVKPAISLISCQLRYEQMRLAGTTPRATDPAHHDAIVRDIVDNLEVLEDSGEFDGVFLYDRTQRCLYPNSKENRQELAAESRDEIHGHNAAEALRDVLYGPWSVEETGHYASLKQQLADLRDEESGEDGEGKSEGGGKEAGSGTGE